MRKIVTVLLLLNFSESFSETAPKQGIREDQAVVPITQVAKEKSVDTQEKELNSPPLIDVVQEAINKDNINGKLPAEQRNQMAYDKQVKIRNDVNKNNIKNFLDLYFNQKLSRTQMKKHSEENSHLITLILKDIDIQKQTFQIVKNMDSKLSDLRVLIQNGARFDSCDSEGKNLLMLAAERNRLEIIDYLVYLGININESGQNSMTALDYALLNKNDEAAKLLRGFGATSSDLFWSKSNIERFYY